MRGTPSFLWKILWWPHFDLAGKAKKYLPHVKRWEKSWKINPIIRSIKNFQNLNFKMTALWSCRQIEKIFVWSYSPEKWWKMEVKSFFFLTNEKNRQVLWSGRCFDQLRMDFTSKPFNFMLSGRRTFIWLFLKKFWKKIRQVLWSTAKVKADFLCLSE